MLVEKKPKDIEIIINTTNQHRQRGRVIDERSTHSPNASQRSDPQNQSSQATKREQKKSPINDFDDESDKNPPKGYLERPHKLLVTKRKRQTNQQELEDIVSEDEVVIEDMDLDANIEDMEFPDEEKIL
jgi:hypothetical protein